MRLHASTLGFSATDLAHFSACGQRTLLDRLKALGEAAPQVFPDPRLDLLRERGREHERRYLESVEALGKQVARVAPLTPEERNPDGPRALCPSPMRCWVATGGPRIARRTRPGAWASS